MEDKRITLTRQELYEKVWSKPLIHLAQELGISDVGIAKICKRYDIPRPPFGYWAKMRNGHKARKTPLPPEKKDEAEPIVITPYNRPFRKVSDDSEPDEFQVHTIEAKKKAAAIEPDLSLLNPHPLIKWAKKAFKQASKEYNGILVPRDWGCLNIKVTGDTLDRALVLLDTLFKLIEECGYELGLNEKKHAVVEMLGERIELRVTERISRVETKRTKRPELHSRAMLSYVRNDSSQEYTYKEYEYIPTGELYLVARSPAFWIPERRWSDTSHTRIEVRFGRIMAGLIRHAALSRQKREEQEERARQREIKEKERQERYRLWQEKQRLIEEERKRVNGLMELAENWQKSNTLRDFINAVKQQAIEVGGSIDADSELVKWLIWAANQADRLDPLTKSPPSILDEDEPRQYL